MSLNLNLPVSVEGCNTDDFTTLIIDYDVMRKTAKLINDSETSSKVFNAIDIIEEYVKEMVDKGYATDEF